MSGFVKLINRLEAQEILTPQDRARLRDLKARQARLEARLRDAGQAVAVQEAAQAARRRDLEAEIRKGARRELAAASLRDLPLFAGE